MRKYGIQINRIIFAGDVHHVGGNYYQGNNGNVNIVQEDGNVIWIWEVFES